MNTTVNATTIVPANVTSEKENLHNTSMLYVVLVYTILEDNGFRFNNPCIGVLLTGNLVLTTLSCLKVSFHGAIDTDSMYIYIRDSQILRPEKVFLYPDAKKSPNVALILCENSHLREFPKLPEKEFQLADFEYCTLCGFGTNEKILKLENFTALQINKSDMEVCNSFSRGSDWICLHFGHEMPCRGDVGAPLLCGGALHAIFNPPVAPWTAPECLDTYGATFTTLHSLVPWIRRVNASLQMTPAVAAFNNPWCWMATGVTAVTAMVSMYLAIMRYVDYRFSREEVLEAPRVIYVRSSQMSRISSRWLWPKPE